MFVAWSTVALAAVTAERIESSVPPLTEFQYFSHQFCTGDWIEFSIELGHAIAIVRMPDLLSGLVGDSLQLD